LLEVEIVAAHDVIDCAMVFVISTFPAKPSPAFRSYLKVETIAAAAKRTCSDIKVTGMLELGITRNECQKIIVLVYGLGVHFYLWNL
jgi:hypothetical protein